MTDLSTFTALPPTAPVRVRWVEYPFCELFGTGAKGCGCPICEGKPRPLHWGGVVHEGEHMWSVPPKGVMGFRESHAMEQGWAKDGTVLAFARDLLLVAGDDGRILTLATSNVRIFSSEVTP
jgi:hypothetical protein